MGCTESKTNALVLENYTAQLKNARVSAAMDALALDKRSVGLRFYRVFASMDIDGSNSIDLDELNGYLGLVRTTLSDQVFSGLGKQASARAVTFDDFVVNMWNFCTMAPVALFTHVFSIYDDDRNGTLDAAECDSLFRLLYHTDELSDDIKRVLKSVDANGDGLLSLKEFLDLCSRNKTLMSPIVVLQKRTREKVLGTLFWSKESSKRSALLEGHRDIIALTQEALKVKDTKASTVDTNNAVRRVSSFDIVVKPTASLEPKASERLAAKQKLQERRDLEKWIEEHRQQPTQDYLTAFSERFVTNSRLERLLSESSAGGDDVTETTTLRYTSAVCAKKFDVAKAKLEAIWGVETQDAIERRHEAVKAMVKGVSTKTLLKQAGKQSAVSAVNKYLQKKLDEGEQDVRRQDIERWEMLDRAAAHIAQQAMNSYDTAHNRPPIGALFVKESQLPSHECTKIVPITAETWTECFDEAHGRNYYVSSLGHSSWDRPDSCIPSSPER